MAWVVYVEGLENGRRMRHIDARFDTAEEARTHAATMSERTGMAFLIRNVGMAGFDDIDINAVQDRDGWDSRDKAISNSEYERDTS